MTANRAAEESDVSLADLLKEVRRIEVQSRRLVTGVMAGGYSSVFRGSGVEFEEVREYVPGDDQRSVDWNVTARMGRPYVKKYVDERERTVVFLLDLSASMGGGFGRWSSRQTAARVCACLALAAVGHDDKVGLIAFSAGVDRYVPPARGRGHALRIVRDCLALSGAARRTGLAPALEFAGRVLRRRAVVFLVSDFLDRGYEQALGRCARRHDLVAVRLLAPELEPTGAALLHVRDPESGTAALLDWRNARVREAYAGRVAAWRTTTEETLRRTNVDRMDVPIPRDARGDAIARPILEFFRMRELRGARG